MHKKYFTLILIFLLALSINNPVSVTSFVNGRTSRLSEEDKKVNSIYTMIFDSNANYYGYINVYQPKFNPPLYELANYYSRLFNIKDNFVDTDEYYIYSEDERSLYIYKNVNLVKFQDNSLSFDKREKINNNIAILIAKDFFKENSINLNYEEVFIEIINGLYYISFIDRVNNLKNFGFKNNVIMDQYGNILGVEYYYNTYEYIGKSKIKPMGEAFYNLPINFDNNEKIYIYNVQMVYIYENSILQPAYFFQGKFLDGSIFESFVKASVYN